MERELTLRADIARLGEVLDFVAGHLRRAGFKKLKIDQAILAVEEIFVNIARYAYDAGGDVAISIADTEDGVSITFSDAGIPFDPLQKADPDVSLPAEERKVGGLGIFLVKQLMDDVSYHFSDGRNQLTMSKNR